MPKAGEIRNRQNIRQIVNFAGLKWGKITPTDIDGYLEFKNIISFYIEAKYKNTFFPIGQKLALERLADDTEAAGKAAVAMIVEHSATGNQDILLADCYVREIRHKGKWYQLTILKTTKEVINWYLAKHLPQLLEPSDGSCTVKS